MPIATEVARVSGARLRRERGESDSILDTDCTIAEMVRDARVYVKRAREILKKIRAKKCRSQ